MGHTRTPFRRRPSIEGGLRGPIAVAAVLRWCSARFAGARRPGQAHAPAPLGAVLLLLVSAAIVAVLVRPWAPPLAARGPADASHECLVQGAETYPVRINVGSYRPPVPARGSAAPFLGSTDRSAITSFRYLLTLDDATDPADSDPESHPAVRPLPSSTSILAEGVQAGNTTLLRLPAGCRWLVTVEANVENRPASSRTSKPYEVWGAPVDLRDQPGSGYLPRDADANGRVVKWIDVVPLPLPTGRLVAHVFADTSPTDGSPDDGERLGADAERPGLSGFALSLRDTAGRIVTKNARGDAICSVYSESGKVVSTSGGRCLTERDGTVVIPDLAPGAYDLRVTPPTDPADPWHGVVPTAAFEGDSMGRATRSGNDSGPGTTLRAVVTPYAERAVHWFGFVLPKSLSEGPTGRIRACAAHAVTFPPYEGSVIVEQEPIGLGWAALSRIGASRVYADRLRDGPGCPGGVIDIRGVAVGNYRLFVWDENLERVGRSVEVTVAEGVAGTAAIVDLPGDHRKGDIGILRRAGWLSGVIFEDSGVAANGAAIPKGALNGARDCVDRADPKTCERGLAGKRIEIRFRDGSVKQATESGADGRYELPLEVSELSRFVIVTVEPGSVSTGPCLFTETLERRGAGWRHSQYNPRSTCTPLTSRLGHRVSASQLTTAGHRSTVDWGLYPPDDAPSRITGSVYYDTTRAEQDPRFARHEVYEPGIAGVPVNLYWTGANRTWDGGPGRGSDDVLVNRYAGGRGTDAFEHPTRENQGANGDCDVLDSTGNPVFPAPATSSGLRAGPGCLEFDVISNETKDGGFDGAFVFEDMCDPADGGWGDTPVFLQKSSRGCRLRVPLAAGNYVVEVGAAENPQSPDFPYEIVKEEDANAGRAGDRTSATTPFPCVGPMHLVRDARSAFDRTSRPLCTHRQVELDSELSAPVVDFFLFTETPISGRIFGRVSDGDRLDGDPNSLRYGNPRAVAGVPVAIRDSAFRLLETVQTDEYGSYQAVLPTTRAACAESSGVCPATYLAVVNDPVGEITATGSVRPSGTEVRGKGTRFLAELEVGDRIRIGTQTRDVTSIESNESLTVDRPWSSPGAEETALQVLVQNPDFDPAYGTATFAFEVLPGKTMLLETALDPVSGPGCRDAAGPEFFRVDQDNGDGAPADPDGSLVVEQSLPTASALRNVTIRGLGFGVERASSTALGRSGFVTLVGPDGNRYVLDDDALYGGSGSPRWTDEKITFRFPRTVETTTLPAAPYHILVTAPQNDLEAPSSLLSTLTGITLHYVEQGRYDPPRRYVDGSSGADLPSRGTRADPYRTIQYAIDRAAEENAPGRLILVLPGLYRENLVLSIRAKLQGFGPGGAGDAALSGLGAEGDVRRSSSGTVVDASFFSADPGIQRRWQAAINERPDKSYPGGPLTGFDVKTHAGAGITVIGGPSTFDVANPGIQGAAVDGFRIRSARTDTVFGTGGGGGVFIAGHAVYLGLTNNVLEGNQGAAGGGIVLGWPGASADSDNRGIRVALNRIAGNGGIHGAGGIAIYDGSDGYVLERNTICSNFSAAGGAGVSHDGRGPGGKIADNVIAFNAAAGAGGGLRIAGRVAKTAGTGSVIVERNVLSGNRANEGGGALEVVGAMGATLSGAIPDRITVVNNQLTNNVAGGAGGAVVLRDSPNVWIVNNTIAKNVSTASCPSCLGGPRHSGGIASWPHSDGLSRLLPVDAAPFSSPVLVNNLFSENASYAFDSDALPGLAGIDALGFARVGDFEVVGRPELRFKPWYSTLSAAYGIDVPAATMSNRLVAHGRQSPFREAYGTELDVGLDTTTGRAAVALVDSSDSAAPPGPSGLPGDYRLCYPQAWRAVADGGTCSSAPVDTGVASMPASAFVGTVAPEPKASVNAPTIDIEGETRPVELRPGTALGAESAYDIGADEAMGEGGADKQSRTPSTGTHERDRSPGRPSAPPVTRSQAPPPEPAEGSPTDEGLDPTTGAQSDEPAGTDAEPAAPAAPEVPKADQGSTANPPDSPVVSEGAT